MTETIGDSEPVIDALLSGLGPRLEAGLPYLEDGELEELASSVVFGAGRSHRAYRALHRDQDPDKPSLPPPAAAPPVTRT